MRCEMSKAKVWYGAPAPRQTRSVDLNSDDIIATCRKKPLLRGWPPPPALLQSHPPQPRSHSDCAAVWLSAIACQSHSATLAIATAGACDTTPQVDLWQGCPPSNILRPVADVKLPGHAPLKQVYARWKL